MVIIEPIRNQYLTALKERQHIIDKLNEIIRGLNALDFDDLTTIHTELVSIREALTTQNQTIIEINDNIEQIESELTSFDNRLIGLNADITDTEAHLTEFENDTISNLQAKVNKNGDTMTGNLGIPTTATGVRNNLAVNGERLQNDLDNYSQMLRTTGNQKKTGNLELTQKLISVSFGKGKRFYETDSMWRELIRFRFVNTGRYVINVNGAVNAPGSVCYGKLIILCSPNSVYTNWVIHKERVSNSCISVNKFNLVFNVTDNIISLYYKGDRYEGIDYLVTHSYAQSFVYYDNVSIRDDDFTPNDVTELTELTGEIINPTVIV